jgi:hypothetical protein
MPYQCPAIHLYKDDYVLTADGLVKIYVKHCCPYMVSVERELCKNHQNRMDEKYHHSKLCQWNYAYNHGLIYGPQNPLSHTTGGAWYSLTVAAHGAPKGADLERLEKAEASARTIAGTMQKKITDYSITPVTIRKTASTTSLSSAVSPKTPRRKKKTTRDGDDESTGTSSTASSSTLVVSKIPTHKRVFIPKGEIESFERNCTPLIIDAIEYVDEL